MRTAKTLEDGIAGALLGVHCGDSLGASCEFMTFGEIREKYPDGLREIVGGGPFDWPAGHATDDTDLTRAVLLAYLSPGADLIRTAGEHMLDWYDGNWPGRVPGSHPFDIGGATRTGLTRFRKSKDWRQAGAGEGSAGNGSLMRCIPTALASVHASAAQRADEATAISAITHDDVSCVQACIAYTEIVVALLNGLSPLEIALQGASGPVAAAIRLGQRIDLQRAVVTGDAGLPHGGTGYVLDSLSLAVAALLDPRPAVDSLVDVIRLGGDTDTNGAIAGGLLGARDGAAAWPAEWISRLQFAEEFRAAAATLSRR